MGPDVLLTVRGRKTGLPRTTPVAIGEIAGRQWLLCPFGDVDWARNLRAAGGAMVRSGNARYTITARSLDRDQRIEFFRDMLHPYLRTHGAAALIHRLWYRLPDDPIAAAERCDVFEVTKTR
jgi:deazaflavin-dependent oxidoreductase (nitroreductase family)